MYTPSLSFFFDENRFTLPEWDDHGIESENIIVSVNISDGDRESALIENMEDWASNPGALLFFYNIKELVIGDKHIHAERTGEGPVTGSEWYDLHATGNKHNVLLIRSAAEELPADAIDEVRKERMDENIELPPVSVDIVLGLPKTQKIYTVLPTDVNTKLPFSCNGPFIQDPARVGLKDPSISPVNRWLLDKCGRLAAQIMLGWLNNSAMDIEHKASAYGFLPPYQVEIKGISDKVTDQVRQGFKLGIESQKIFLASDNTVVTGDKIFSIPKALYEVWDETNLLLIFGREPRNKLLALEVKIIHINTLQQWDSDFDKQAHDDIGRLLTGTYRVPKPETLEALMALWVFFATDLTKGWRRGDWRNMKIVPVEGKDYLTASEDTIRLSHEVDSATVGQVLGDIIDILDGKWIRVLEESVGRAEGQSKLDAKLLERIEQANYVLDRLGLNQSTPINVVVSSVTKILNKKHRANTEILVVTAKLFAHLDANVGKDFPFICRDDSVRNSSDTIIYKPRPKAIELLPETWLSTHELSPLYDEYSDCCSELEWRKWASSNNSSLRRFKKPDNKYFEFYSRAKLQEFYAKSGLIDLPDNKIVTESYIVIDYDFDEDDWTLWQELATTKPEIWSDVLLEIISDVGEISIDLIQPKVTQQGKTRSHRLDNIHGLVTSWIVKMRELPCLIDTYSVPQKPGDLLLRNPDTDPLRGVEPFVHQDFDVQKSTFLLKALGVRDCPQGVESLLRRVKTAPLQKELPFSDLLSWYKGIDSIVANYSEAQLVESGIVEIFRTEELIISEEQKWFKSADIFLEKDHESQGEPVVNAAINSLPLWMRLGVERRLTIEHIISNLQLIQYGSPLDSDMHNAVQRWLSRDPTMIVEEVKGWTSIYASWESIESFKWCITENSTISAVDLFADIQRKTANFSIHHESFINSIGLQLKQLSKCLDYRIRNVKKIGSPEKLDWMHVIGELIEKVNSDDESPGVFGKRLKNTFVQLVDKIEVVPFLDNSPAGVESQPKIYWHKETLYVSEKIAPKNAEEIVGELSRHLDDSSLRRAIRITLMRETAFINEYFKANFDLSRHINKELAHENSGEGTIDGETAHVDENGEPQDVDDEGQTFGDQTENEMPNTGETDHPDSDEEHATEILRDEEEAESTNDDDSEEKIEKDSISKAKVFESYIQKRGYKWSVTAGCYIHRNNTKICKSDLIFPYEKLLSSGEVECYYYVLTSNFAKGITVPPDVYKYLNEFPRNVIFLLLSDEKIEEVSGTKIQSDVNSGAIGVYPKSYLLKTND